MYDLNTRRVSLGHGWPRTVTTDVSSVEIDDTYTAIIFLVSHLTATEVHNQCSARELWTHRAKYERELQRHVCWRFKNRLPCHNSTIPGCFSFFSRRGQSALYIDRASPVVRRQRGHCRLQANMRASTVGEKIGNCIRTLALWTRGCVRKMLDTTPPCHNTDFFGQGLRAPPSVASSLDDLRKGKIVDFGRSALSSRRESSCHEFVP